MKPGRSSRSNEEIEDEIRIGYRLAGVGIEVTSEVAAGALLGWGFDAWQGTAPKGLLIGSLVGIAVGLWNLIRRTFKLNKILDQQHSTKGRGRPLPLDDDDEHRKRDD